MANFQQIHRAASTGQLNESTPYSILEEYRIELVRLTIMGDRSQQPLRDSLYEMVMGLIRDHKERESTAIREAAEDRRKGAELSISQQALEESRKANAISEKSNMIAEEANRKSDRANLIASLAFVAAGIAGIAAIVQCVQAAKTNGGSAGTSAQNAPPAQSQQIPTPISISVPVSNTMPATPTNQRAIQATGTAQAPTSMIPKLQTNSSPAPPP